MHASPKLFDLANEVVRARYEKWRQLADQHVGTLGPAALATRGETRHRSSKFVTRRHKTLLVHQIEIQDWKRANARVHHTQAAALGPHDRESGPEASEQVGHPPRLKKPKDKTPASREENPRHSTVHDLEDRGRPRAAHVTLEGSHALLQRARPHDADASCLSIDQDQGGGLFVAPEFKAPTGAVGVHDRVPRGRTLACQRDFFLNRPKVDRHAAIFTEKRH